MAIICFMSFCMACYAQNKENKDITSQKITKNKGEVVFVDTGLFCFKIRDQEGNETKFFAPKSRLRMINIGENIQVNYKKTIDGKLKALETKSIKAKKKTARI